MRLTSISRINSKTDPLIFLHFSQPSVASSFPTLAPNRFPIIFKINSQKEIKEFCRYGNSLPDSGWWWIFELYMDYKWISILQRKKWAQALPHHGRDETVRESDREGPPYPLRIVGGFWTVWVRCSRYVAAQRWMCPWLLKLETHRIYDHEKREIGVRRLIHMYVDELVLSPLLLQPHNPPAIFKYMRYHCGFTTQLFVYTGSNRQT